MGLQKKLILFAEDNKELQTMATEVLELSGFVVIPSATGRKTLELLESGLQPDCLFVDLNVNDMQCEEYVSALTSVLGEASSSLVLTGHHDLEYWSTQCQFGRILAKPYNIETLIKTANEVCDDLTSTEL